MGVLGSTGNNSWPEGRNNLDHPDIKYEIILKTTLGELDCEVLSNLSG
jgi:hypothetical protein